MAVLTKQKCNLPIIAKTFLWLKAVVMIPSLMNVSYDLMSVISESKQNNPTCDQHISVKGEAYISYINFLHYIKHTFMLLHSK